VYWCHRVSVLGNLPPVICLRHINLGTAPGRKIVLHPGYRGNPDAPPTRPHGPPPLNSRYIDINARSAGPPSCSPDTSQRPVSWNIERGVLLWRTPHPCLARAPLPISFASRVSAAAPLFRSPLAGPLVSRKRRAARSVALVARASRALISRRKSRTRHAAVLALRASRTDSALASRGRHGATLPLSSPLCCSYNYLYRAARMP